MPLTIFIPHQVAERCYLSEALLWVAVNRFPLAHIGGDGFDVRENEKLFGGLDPDHLEFGPLNTEECTWAGLPPNPEYEELEAGNVLLPLAHFERILELDLPDEERTKLEHERLEAKAFSKRQSAWDEEFDSFLDLHRTHFFLALREGKLAAEGKEMPRPTYAESIEHLEKADWEGWGSEIPWKPIPATFWISNKIDWTQSWAEGRTTAYCLILVDSAQLFECFPARTEPTDGVVRIADVVSVSTSKAPSATSGLVRGRRPFDWSAFHVEVARRIRNDDLPAKQEAAIAEMQEWCRTEWRRKVSRSALLQKLKPYYDEFMRKSENTRK